MRENYFLLAMVAWSQKADTVEFNGSHLEAAVSEEMGKTEGVISSSDMETLTLLSAVNESITNLTGLEYAVNLADLSQSFWARNHHPLYGIRTHGGGNLNLQLSWSDNQSF